MRLSARLRALHPAEKASPRASSAAATAPAALPRVHALGQRQLAVLGPGGFSDRQDLTASDVAKVLGYTPSNATSLLKRLEELEYLVRVTGERPARLRRPSPADV